MPDNPQHPEDVIGLLEGFAALREAASPNLWNAGLHQGQLLSGPLALETVIRQFTAQARQQPLPKRPQFNLEEARQQWQRYLATREPGQIERRALRCLCWDPEVTATPTFLRLIENQERPPSASMILGLLGVYHVLWGGQNNDLERRIIQWVHGYQGYNPILQRLTEIMSEVVGSDAAPRAARSAFEKHCTARQLLEERGFATNTPYASAVAGGLLNANMHKLERAVEVNQARYICEQLVPEDRDLLRDGVFANTVKRFVTLASGTAGSTLRDTVKSFALLEPRLGDPRRHPGRWDNLGLSTEAEMVKGWLSKEDLEFFFDLIMEGQEDRHHRRDFWLRYVHRVVNSCVALGEADRRRLQIQLRDLKKRGRTYAQLGDWDTSAFVMDFGSAIVVEFSQVGNACSVYPAKLGREKVGDLNAERFSKYKLKTYRDDPGWFRHDSSGKWMREVRQYLAKFGVRE